MAKEFACQDAGMDCPGKFTVETESELMQHVEVHAKAAHPDLQVTPELQRQIKSLTKTV
jgi:predicted small metal-binding protein